MDNLVNAFHAFLAGAPYIILHLSVSCVILAFGVVLYVKSTPINELDLIRNGNLAAGISFSGALISLALPLSASLASSMTIPTILIWGSTAIIIQLFCDRLAGLLIGNIYQRISNNELSAVFALVGIKISVAMLNSAVISG
tara:strand:- start:985 stop:1407 length:423 start_codon:yes stop_codon:yes gene_type:complete